MTQNNGSRYAPGYDLFKLIVAVILTIILIFLLLQESGHRYAVLSLTVTASSLTEETVLSTITSTPPVPSATPFPTSTSQPIPPEPTLVEPTPTELVPTAVPSPTETTIAEATPAFDQNGCPAIPFQVQMGDKVVIKNWLNFRTGPGLYFKILHTNRPGTELEVIGGPVCTIRVRGNTPRAYIWWKVRMKDGREGWSVQAPLNNPTYLLEPVR